MKIKNTKLTVIQSEISKIKSSFIVNTAHFDRPDQSQETQIRLSMREVFRKADRAKAKTIVFPAMGGVENQFPLVGSAKIMTQEVLKFLRENKTTLERIIFCLSTQKEFKIFEKSVYGYVDHVLHKLSEGPYVTVDAIIELGGGIILIERSNPPYGLALPGGFVDYGESLEEAVCREAKEETNLKLVQLRQFHTYSKPERDPRFHTIATVFVAKAKGTPKSGDDAKGLRIVKYADLVKYNYAFDHKEVIRDYLNARKSKRK